MSTLGSSARRCNSEDNLASLLALPNDKRLTVARLRALGELNRLCSTSLLHCDTDLVRLLDRVRMLDDAQLLQLLPLQSVVADLNSMLATVAERLELSGARPRTFPNDSTSPVRANGSAGSGASVSCGEDVSVGMHSSPQMRRSLEDNSDGRMATTHMLASPDRFSPAGLRADSKGLERHMELIVQALMVLASLSRVAQLCAESIDSTAAPAGAEPRRVSPDDATGSPRSSAVSTESAEATIQPSSPTSPKGNGAPPAFRRIYSVPGQLSQDAEGGVSYTNANRPAATNIEGLRLGESSPPTEPSVARVGEGRGLARVASRRGIETTPLLPTLKEEPPIPAFSLEPDAASDETGNGLKTASPDGVRPSPSGGRSGGLVVCRICERPFPLAMLRAHTPECLRVHAESGRGSLRLSDFVLLKPVSSGTHGRVMLCRKRSTGDVLAMKITEVHAARKKNIWQQLQHEADILRRCADYDEETSYDSSRFVVGLFYSFRTPDTFFMAMEYLGGGDLGYLLSALGRVTDDVCRQYCSEISLALRYLHQRGVIHRDIKPGNILIGADGHLKLADFGLSHVGVLQLDPLPTAAYGTPDYMAPELLLAQPYSAQVDWWALGVIAFEMLAGLPPFHDSTPSAIFPKILRGKIDWKHISSDESQSPPCREALAFIEALLQPNPASRLGGEDAQKHPFFRGVRWNLVYQDEPVFRPVLSTQEDTSYFEDRDSGLSFDGEWEASLSKHDSGLPASCFSNVHLLALRNFEIAAQGGHGKP